jgi:hypothetical protein
VSSSCASASGSGRTAGRTRSAKRAKDIGVDAIGLRQLARGLGEVAHLPRIDHHDWEPRRGERADAEQLVAVGHLEDDELRRLTL